MPFRIIRCTSSSTVPALRICVSAPVQEALQATGRVNGPIECIPNGLDIEALATQRQSEHNGKILVDGTKNAQLAASIGEALARHGAAYEVLTKRLPRPGYLRHLSGFSAAVLLPLPYEGFYLPALEAMALGVPLVIPPCTGTRDFCIPDKTCLSPDRAPDALAEAATQLLANPERAEVLRRGGYDMATRHSLKQERQALFDILGKAFRMTAPASLATLITGLPRSGTTLTTALLNRQPDTVALIEPMALSKMPRDGRRFHQGGRRIRPSYPQVGA